MKSRSLLVLSAVLALTLSSVQAQPGRGRGMGASAGPSFSGATAKLFGDVKAFSADMEMQTKGTDTGSITMNGKFAFDEGKSHFEMDMSTMKNSKMPAGSAAQMKAMGMDKMVMIGVPDKKVNYMIYPGMEAYVEMPIKDEKVGTSPDDYKIVITELGKETVDGHPCIKNKAVVTDKEGTAHESTLWNATDLKNFPIKMEMTEQGTQVTMFYKNPSFSKPDASQFAPPSGYKKYESMQQMMMETMMKKRGGFPNE